MKKRISTEQLQELSEEQKKRLREWWQPATGDCAVKDREEFWVYGATRDTLTFAEVDWDFEMRIDCPKKDCLPSLSIGQCLELLKEQDPQKLGRLFAEIIIPDFTVDWEGKEIELIDALWSAVKSVL